MVGVFTSRVLWNPVFRTLMFWAVTISIARFVYLAWAPFPLSSVFEILSEATHGDITRGEHTRRSLSLRSRHWRGGRGATRCVPPYACFARAAGHLGRETNYRAHDSKTEFAQAIDRINARLIGHPLWDMHGRSSMRPSFVTMSVCKTR